MNKWRSQISFCVVAYLLDLYFWL